MSLARPGARPRRDRRLPAALPSAKLAARFAPPGGREVAEAPLLGRFSDLASSRRTLIVSFRRDGTPVPTPVWAALAGENAYVRTERVSGKVKRLRREPRVLLAPCTVRGRPLSPPVAARGRVLSAEEEPEAERVLARRYGLGREAFERAMDVLRVDMCYLELVPES